MASKVNPNKKVTDADIIRLNSVGLSLATIAYVLGCHTSTITQRLKAMGIPPADTRRAFMEDIYQSLSPDQKLWLEGQLGPHISIKNFVKNLLVKAALNANQGERNAA